VKNNLIESSIDLDSYSSGLTFPNTLSSFIAAGASTAPATVDASSATATTTTTSALATGNSPSWIATLQNSLIRTDMTAASAGGTVSETGMAKLFTDLAAQLTSSHTKLSASEFSDLKIIANDLNVGETASPYITYITDALVLGNAADANWTGGNATASTLGDLTIGSTATQLSELTGKWFLGTDLPSDAIYMTGYSPFVVSYSANTAPLYNSGGPSIHDVNQGDLGDCFLMASLAEVASQNPSLITSMITANGNNTYGVQFVVNGAAEYVTVSNTLADGGTVFNSGTAIWASLIEQAYAQLQAGGVVTGNTPNYGNSWSTIGNGGYPEYALAEITGATKITDFCADGPSWQQYVYNNSMTLQSSSTGIGSASVLSTIISDLAVNDDVILSSYTNAYASNGMQTLVADHAMAIYGYDSATGNLEVYNPWGTESGQYWDTTFEVSISTLFYVGDTITIDNVGTGNTTIPILSGIVETPSNGELNAGKSVTITLDFNTGVTVSGGTPTLTLNDGGTATYASGSGSAALSFTYTVAAGDSGVSSLIATAVNLNGAMIADFAGNAQLSLSGLTQSGPQIDTTIPALNAIAETPSNGTLNAGQHVVFTVDLTEAVDVSGTPTLLLNDGGTATFTGGSGSDELTFSYTVSLFDENVLSLAAITINLNGGSIEDGAGNNANLSLGGLSQTGPGIYTPGGQIDAMYQAVLKHLPTSGEMNAALAEFSTFGLSGVVATVVDSPEAQQNVYSVVQIIDLATGSLPSSAQLSGWVPFVESAGLLESQSQTIPLLDQMAEAFVASTMFGNTYNGGTAVNPNAPITASIASAIIQAATGIAATQEQIDAWVATDLSIDQVFVDFALGDQYSAFLQSNVQQYLTTPAIQAASDLASNFTSINTPNDGLNAPQVQGAYQAVLQRAPTAPETNAAQWIDGSLGNVAALAAVVNSPEAQYNVNPIVQIIELATGSLPTAAQLAGWVPFVESAGLLQGQSQTDPLLDQMAEAFVASTMFGNTYNGGTAVDPNAPITASIVAALIQAATGVAATQSQIDAWVGTGLSIDQVFVGFALGDQYTAASQNMVQDYLTATAINGAELSTVDGISATGALTLGTLATPLTGNELTVQGGSGSLTVVADGTDDTINLGVVSIGTSITAAQTIHASGAGDTITFATQAADGTAVTWAGAPTVDGGTSSTGIGANSTVNFGNNTGGGTETVVVTGDLTGATTSGGTSTSGIAMTTLGNVHDAAGDQIVFNNATTEILAGTAAINVTSAGSSLAKAFDLAAADAAASQSGGTIGADTGVIDWFQLSGNTYIVEAINNTASAASHSALAATDEVVKITGLVTLSGETLAGHTLTL
jgi:hypothetical protein